MILYAVDPGKKKSGIALFIDSRLVEVAYVESIPTSIGRAVLLGIEHWPSGAAPLWVIEQPQIYRAGKSKGNPNDLIELAIVVGMFSHAAATTTRATPEHVLPRTWSGGRPDTVNWQIMRDALDEVETAALALRDNKETRSAVAIGLWRLGRLR